MKPFDEPIYVTRPMLPDLEDVFRELQGIWASRWLTNNGPVHQAFEEEVRRHLKVPYLSLFNNGTIALLVAAGSLCLKGEVITTPFTFPATPHALFWNGITPVFCDIDETSMTIDPGKIEGLVTPATSAILGVHVFGTPCDTEAIQRIAARHGLKVMYDAAHAFDTEIDGVGIGSFGDVSMFSFHATKLFHTAEGGALTCNELDQKQRIDLMKNFGIRNEEEVAMPGINGKMNEIQAALGLVNLRLLEVEREKRRTIVDTYRRCLRGAEGVTITDLPSSTVNSYQYFVIRINRARFGTSRDEVYSRLRQFNVFARKYFYPLCSDYPCYRDLPSADPVKLPVAQKVVSEVLCLPLYGDLSVSSVERICAMIESFRE